MIRTQKDKKLQTLIEVCTDFASLSHTTSVHRPAEQVFALEEEDDQEEEMFAVVDRQQWNTQRAAEPPLSPDSRVIHVSIRKKTIKHCICTKTGFCGLPPDYRQYVSVLS